MSQMNVGDLIHLLTKLGISAVSHEAQEVLRHEPTKLTALYVYWCRHRDYSTSVVGMVRRISYQSMIEWMETPATSGRSAEKYTKPMIQSCIRRLVAVGLAVDHGNCVYYLPYEVLDQSVLRRLLRGCYEGDTIQAVDSKHNSGGSLLRGKSEVATPLINLSINQSVVDKFEMTDDWLPKKAFVEQARLAGFDINTNGKDFALYEAALGDVRAYWQSKGGELRNQHGWHLSLLGTMKMMKQKLSKPVRTGTPAGGFKRRGGDGLPKDDNELSSWARKHGAPAAGVGMSAFNYRLALRDFLNGVGSSK